MAAEAGAQSLSEEAAVSAARGPDRPLSGSQTFWYSLANLGYGAFYSYNNFVLPLLLSSMTRNAVVLGLMGSTHSVEGAVIQPLVGAASDRFHSRLGRRRPFMLLFTPLSALFMVLTVAATWSRTEYRLGAAVLCVFLFTVTFNVAFDPYQALLPDITPASQRGRVTSIWALVGNIGQAAILLLPALVPLALKGLFDARHMLVIVALLMVATTLITCAMVREPPSRGQQAARRPIHELAEALRGLLVLRQAGKVVWVAFLTGAGIGAVLPFLTLFVKAITHCSDAQALEMPLVLMAATAAGVVPFGWLADRIGPKRVLAIGLTLIAAAAAAGWEVTSLRQIMVVLAVAGLGNAAQAAAAYPLLTDLVPGEETGFYTGLQTTALSIAQPATVFVTGILINRGGYRMVFVVCAAAIVGGIGLLACVRETRAPAEIAARRGQTAK